MFGPSFKLIIEDAAADLIVYSPKNGNAKMAR
jgi:hypothetical protein